MNILKGIKYIEVNRGSILSCLICWTIFLGLWGYFFEHPAWSLWDRLYSTIQLFILEYDDLPQTWQVELARWLGVVTSSFTLVLGFIALFYKKYISLILRFFNSHYIVCGYSPMAKHLICDLLEKQKNVVLLADVSLDIVSNDFNNQDLYHIQAEPTKYSILLEAGIQKASYLFAFFDEDIKNMELAYEVHQTLLDSVASKKCNILRNYIHIIDSKMCIVLRDKDLFLNPHSGLEFQIINLYEIMARKLLNESPLDYNPIMPSSNNFIHLILIGFGCLGEILVIKAIQLYQMANQQKTLISIIDLDSENRKQELYAKYPQINTLADIEFIHADIEKETLDKQFTKWLDNKNAIISAVFCFNEKRKSFLYPHNISQQLKKYKIPIFVRIPADVDQSCYMNSEFRDAAFNYFGALNETATLQCIVEDELDHLAKVIHKNYLESAAKKNDFGMTESHKSWNQLNMYYRESNRLQALHIGIKLRTLGLQIICATSEVEEYHFSKEDIEILAEMEHKRWLAFNRLENFTEGPNDIKQRTHPDMKEWQDLDEETKDYDRDAVKNIPDYLKKVGKKIVK